MSLSGLVLLRNAVSLDYCFVECIKSLLPVCDEVVVCEGQSTDGTRLYLDRWVEIEPKLKLCVYPWPDPHADIDFYVTWIQYGRDHCRSTHVCHLDGDEVLDERSYGKVTRYKHEGHRKSLRCTRLNYWKDHRHLIPPGVCLADRVVRLCPQDVFLPSDGAHPLGGPCIEMAMDSQIVIHHFGFLRRPDAYFAKSKLLHGYFFGTYDKRLTDAEAHGAQWMEAIRDVEWTERLVPYSGPWPALAHQWMRDRGYEP